MSTSGTFEAFGEAAYDAMTRAGVGMRTFRQLRKLPEDARQLVINGEAVRLDDKEEVEEYIEDLVERHTKETQVLHQQVNGLKGDLEASRKVVQAKTTAHQRTGNAALQARLAARRRARRGAFRTAR